MLALFYCDDSNVIDLLCLALKVRWPDLHPVVATDRDTCLRLLAEQSPRIMFVGANSNEEEAFTTIKKVRQSWNGPLIAVLPSTEEHTVVRALDTGADDFIRVPFGLMEAVARVMALMRRAEMDGDLPTEDPISWGDLLIKPSTYEVFLGDTRLDLTGTEFRLLHVLARNKGATLTSEFLQQLVWEDDVGRSQALKKYIQRLRRKLGDDVVSPRWIKTVHGVGYRVLERPARAA